MRPRKAYITTLDLDNRFWIQVYVEEESFDRMKWLNSSILHLFLFLCPISKV